MFSNLTVGIVLGIGVAGWVYAKLQRYTGGNTQSSLIGAVIVGLIVALVGTTLMSLVF
jgi:hypothetical protein